MEEIHSDTLYDLSLDWLSKDMGIEERRMCSDGDTPSDLAIEAGQKAIESCPDLNPSDIDAVIFCGIERDHPEPATAHTIQNKLNLNAHHVFDIANACFGFVDGLKIATALIETGMIRHALIVTGEVSTRVSRSAIDILKTGVSHKVAQTMLGALSLGDAGGAIILGQSRNTNSGFQAFNQRCESKYVDLCTYKVNSDGSMEGHMQMAQIVARGFRLNKGMFDETLSMLGWDGLDWALTHQTGKRTFQQILTLKSIEESKLIQTYPKLGNITTATLPVSLSKLHKSGKMKSGDRIGGLFAGSGLVTGQFGYVV